MAQKNTHLCNVIIVSMCLRLTEINGIVVTHHFEIDTFSLVLSLHKWWFAYMISTKVRTVLTTNTTKKIKFLKSFKCLNEGLYELTFVSSVLSVPSVKLHP